MDDLVDIDVVRLSERCNPFQSLVWRRLRRPITREEIATTLRSGFTRPKESNTYTRAEHIRIIAYFVRNGWLDPIDLDVGVPSLGAVPEWIIMDGNHRFAAALYRGDASIVASYSGSVNELRKLRFKHG